MNVRRLGAGFVLASAGIALAALGAAPNPGGITVAVPRALLAGYHRIATAPHGTLELAIDLTPRDHSLDSAAQAIVDPGSPTHRSYLSADAFANRFGRTPSEIDAVRAWLKRGGASNVYVAKNRLTLGARIDVANAAKLFRVPFASYASGGLVATAPAGDLRVPFAYVRAVRGAVSIGPPRFEDVTTLPQTFRGEWFAPRRFRAGYDAQPGGGAGMRVVLIEDGSQRADLHDLVTFLQGHAPIAAALTPTVAATPSAQAKPTPEPQPEFAAALAVEGPFGGDAARVRTIDVPGNSAGGDCGRDDGGQEATIDLDATIALAPAADVVLRYDRICVAGGDGTLALERALDDATPNDVLVLPFAVAALTGPASEAFGPTPIAYLEAALRGIPVVVPSGDDGAYGIRVAGETSPAVTYPCVLPVVICAGGSALGTRDGELDEAPWNDGVHASGGGISHDPRPSWQSAPSAFEFSPQFVKNRIVPDVSADAAGHLYIFWNGYGSGGVGGTSESASLVGAELAAIDGAVPPPSRLVSAGDLYALATAHPTAFRDVTRANDRGHLDNTLRPLLPRLPPNFTGVVPTPVPLVEGCVTVQPDGCAVKPGYDAVTGIGSLMERAAIAALSPSPQKR